MSDRDLSVGIVAFLFTDIESSTKRWEHHPEAMKAAVERHDAILRHAIEANSGYVFRTEGDAFRAAFSIAPQALQAALDAQHALYFEPWREEIAPLRVRMALHTGAAEIRDGDYVGPSLNRMARLLSAAHGGQTLLSMPTEQLVRDNLPPGVTLRDLGEHHLKDLIRPERIFQLVAPGAPWNLPSDFPPLKTLDNRPNNLPIQVTAFIGREKEVAAVCGLLRLPETRLLTLIGPAGTGKSRLALQAGAEMADEFEDGVFFVALAPVTDPALVAPTVAQTLRVKETRDQPLQESLKDYLHDQEMLLLLDNFEQVVDAAPLVGELLAAAPRLKVLITSREMTHVYGEKEYPVSPLALPDPKHLPPLKRLAQYEAVRLFMERAMDVKPDFSVTNENAQAVAEICYRLDGLPLAIELAAARIRLFPPQALLGRLSSRLKLLTGGAKDRPMRQQTLRGAIDWSYDLLDPAEQKLFARLSVFAGGCILEAVETVCKPETDPQIDVLDGVASLVEKSLLRQEEVKGEPRFVMLETIREYAAERLQDGGEGETLRQQHAEYYLATVEEAARELSGPGQAEWLARLESDYDNLRVALQWARARESGEVGEVELGLRLAIALVGFWEARGPLSEGQRWLQELLASEEGRSPALRAAALTAAGRLAFAQHDLTRGAGLVEQGLTLYRELGDRRGIPEALSQLGIVAIYQGHFGRAAGSFEESLALGRELGDKKLISRSLWGLAWALARQGDVARVAGLAGESLQLYRELGDMRGMSDALEVLAHGALIEGNLTRAQSLVGESLALLRQPNMYLDAQIRGRLERLALLARDSGKYEEAAALLEEGIVLSLRVGDRRDAAHLRMLLALMARERGQYERATALLEESLAVFRELGDAYGIGRAILGLGDVARDQGDAERAFAFSKESLALFRELGDALFIGYSLHNLGVAARQQGDYVRAEALLKEALAQFPRARGYSDEVLTSVGQLALDQSDYPHARKAFAESLRIGGGTGSINWLIAANLEGLAEVAIGKEQAERAAQLLGAADSLRGTFGTPIRPSDRATYEQHMGAARVALGEERFKEAWEQGRTMTVGSAIAYALRETWTL